jgi:sigma-70-like protein
VEPSDPQHGRELPRRLDARSREALRAQIHRALTDLRSTLDRTRPIIWGRVADKLEAIAWLARLADDEHDQERVERRRARQDRARSMWLHYAAGATLAEVGATFGLSPERVRQIFAEAYLPRRPAKRRTTSESQS